MWSNSGNSSQRCTCCLQEGIRQGARQLCQISVIKPPITAEHLISTVPANGNFRRFPNLFADEVSWDRGGISKWLIELDKNIFY